jgi:hypothetical protein
VFVFYCYKYFLIHEDKTQLRKASYLKTLVRMIETSTDFPKSYAQGQAGRPGKESKND